MITPCKTMKGHTNWIKGALQLPGGHIITCSTDGSLRRWDLERGAQIGDDWRDDDKGVNTIALSPDGNTIASGCDDGKVRLWDVETDKVIAKWTGHTKFVRSVCWRTDGEAVLSGSQDGTARVWDIKTGETDLGPIETGHDDVWAVIYSPDSTKFATAGYGDTDGVNIWDAKSGDLLFELKHDFPGRSLAWTSDDKNIISSSHESIRIFDTATGQEIAVLEGHSHFVNAISLSPNDRVLASASYDNTVRLWNLDTNLQVGKPLQHKGWVQCATFCAGGRLLVTGCDDEKVYVWDSYAILQKAGLEDLLPKIKITEHNIHPRSSARAVLGRLSSLLRHSQS